MTRHSGLLLLILIATCLLLSSCTGLLSSRGEGDAAPSIRIVLSSPAATSRSAALPTQSDIDYYTVAILNQDTDAVVAGPLQISGGTYQQHVPAGNYYVVVEAFDTSYGNYTSYEAPVYVGVKEDVTVGNAQVNVELRMVPLYLECTNTVIKEGETWATGILPEIVAPEGIDAIWLENTVVPVTRFTDTTEVEYFSFSSFFTKMFYVCNSGSGSGVSAASPMDISSAFSTLTTYVSEHPTVVPTLSLTEDIALPGIPISFSVFIDGNGHKVTCDCSEGAVPRSYVIQFGNDDDTQAEYILSNVIVDGEDTRQGIINNGGLVLFGCTIQNCYQDATNAIYDYNKSGAGIFTQGSLVMQNCVIKNCTSTKAGGGISLWAGSFGAASAELINCTISNCKATKEDVWNGAGGGLYAYDNRGYPEGKMRLTLNNVTMEDCTADSGGCINCLTDNITINIVAHCKFIRGKTTYIGSGGGINVSGSINFDSCTSCEFIECKTLGEYGGEGGGLFCGASNLKNCTFKDCMATKKGGGGAKINLEEGQSCSITNCSFINCTTTYGESCQGGGFCCDNDSGTSITISNSYFTNCRNPTLNEGSGGPDAVYTQCPLTINGQAIASQGNEFMQEYIVTGDITPTTTFN